MRLPDEPAASDPEAALDAFDPRALRAAMRLLRVGAAYHRLEVRGLERLPGGRALLVGNHNGGAAPVDGLFLPSYYERFGLGEPVHVLAHEAFFRVRPVGRLAEKIGVLVAHPDFARVALERERKVLVFPGSDLDSLRTFAERKKVKLAGHQGFARLALRTRAPVVPVVAAGAHEGFVVLAQGLGIARALGVPRLFRWHSFPAILCLPYGLALGPFAYLPYLPLPARIDVEVGEPIHPDAFDHLPEPERAPALYAATEARMQSMLTALYAGRRLPVLG